MYTKATILGKTTPKNWNHCRSQKVWLGGGGGAKWKVILVMFFGDIMTMMSQKWRHNWSFEVSFRHNQLKKQNLATTRNFRSPKSKIKGP